jgi:ribosomal protein L11 methyltransferase
VSASSSNLLQVHATQPQAAPFLNTPWWDLLLQVTAAHEDLVYWRLETFGCQGMTSEQEQDFRTIHAYIPLSQASLLDLAALSLQLRQDALLAGFTPPTLSWERLESEDWSSSWKAHWQPMPVGDRLLICPAWMDPPPTDRQVVLIDPGMAFGTGVHPTTQLCLEALEMRLEGVAASTAPVRIADIGCGSGILSIGAALLGSHSVFAVDTDPLAVEATLANRDRNQLHSQIKVFQGSLEHVPDMVDGLVCNILADVIMDMIPEFKLVVQENGWLILSGILVEQAKIVAETLEANDWIVAALWKRKEWCCLNVRMS